MKEIKKRGKLIAIEGISCSGKTTLINRLEKLFIKDNVIFLGGYDIRKYSSEFTKLSNKLCKDMPYFDLPLIVELHFFISEILYDIEKIIKPAILQGKTVIYDNYWLSIYVIESSICNIKYDSKESKKHRKYIKKVMKDVEKIFDVIKPDLIIYVDTPIEITINRMKKRDNYNVDYKYIYTLQENINRLYIKILNKNMYKIKNDLSKRIYDEKIYKLYKFLKENYVNE